jgi:ABC-type transporter Mla subunit MlaD
VLIGALTVLVAIVAVVLAFQANNGLPFVPRYMLHVQVRDAEELTRGGEVHMGGTLIGTVTSVQAQRARNGQPVAVLNLALNKSVQPLPVNSRFTIRLKAAIGEKYLDVTLGHSGQTWRNGATVPASDTGAEVDLDQVLSMFTPPTRAGIASSTVGLSDGLAGRGTAINGAIGAFVPLVSNLTPVMHNLSAPQTDLRGFIVGLAALNLALAPVSDQQAALYANLDTTFRALAGVANPYLRQAIAAGPALEQTLITDSPAEQAFARNTGALFADLRPAVAPLTQGAPVLTQAFDAGAHNLPRTAATASLTTSLSHALGSYSSNPAVQTGLDRLTQTANSLLAPLNFLTPVQTSCNYITLFLRNIGSSLSDPVGSGTVLRFVQISSTDVPGGEAGPSTTPYLTNNPAAGADQAPLHVDAYPNTDSPGQIAECSAGNEKFNASSPAIGNPIGDVGLKTETTTAKGGK